MLDRGGGGGGGEGGNLNASIFKIFISINLFPFVIVGLPR